jgi:CRP-like cAMP-binding protein
MIDYDIFLSIDVFKRANDSSLAALAPHAILQKYKKGKRIFSDRDEIDALFCVSSGTVALYKLSSLGEERGVFIYGAGALLNEDVLDGKYTSIEAKTLSDSEILRIKRGAILKAISGDFPLAQAVMASMSMKIRRLYHLMKNTSNNVRGDRRIAAKLWKLSRDHGVRTKRGVEIDFDLPITLLAGFMGSQRETVSRQVKSLSEENLVIFENSRFIIPDRAKLLEYFEDAE